MLKEKCSFCRELELDDGSDRCIFHCEKDSWVTKHDPSNDKFDLGTEVIYYWDEEKVQKFWKKFKKLIEKKDLSKEESYDRFHGFIFPKIEQDTFKNYTFNCDLVFTKDCIFEGDINFFQTIFNKQIYFNDCKIKGKVCFGKSIFKDRFTFNNMKEIKEVFFKHAEFKEKVEFKESSCKKVDFENAIFEKLADFYRTKFYKVNFEKTDFKDIAVFSEAEFYCDVDFRYTKFLGTSIFRDTVITGKLDLKNSIFKDEANFLDIKLSKVESRETARKIKDSFEKQNNIIEANKFYALEMKEREKELEEDLKKGKNFFEWLVFKIHGISSNHSQDWLLALFLIISFTFLSVFIEKIFNSSSGLVDKYILSLIMFVGITFINFYIANTKKAYYLISIFIYYFIYSIFTQDWLLKCFSNKLNPFSIMTGNEELIFSALIYKIIIAYLIYQFIVSIRRNTRRK
ncbi:pentapeptide repeat-containing protein [Aliarcobacter skirrowii]|uniref:Pentapeptide repeat-containing protein n=1 Tax=Aliarcobacter skirrowii TaxID=28200 RepID=A0AAW9D946_9BACT|nr:pentapeptide repeat-containing protein [Aliarcobacter skirrowii]MDX4068681.1 pentapeptide repeat-containing protein [Aliarcobacter skirrowii]